MWFANRGQIIQTAFAGAALLAVLAKDWPTADRFLSLSSLIVLLVATFFLISLIVTLYSLTRTSPSKVESVKPEIKPVSEPEPRPLPVEKSVVLPPKPKEPEYQTKIEYEKMTVRLGAKEPLQKTQGLTVLGREYLVELIDIHPYEHKGSSLIRAGRFSAELQFDFGGGVGSAGRLVNEVGTNRFIVPVATEAHNSEDLQVFNFSSTDTHVWFFSVRVEHINSHEKTASLIVTDLRASKYRTL